MYAIVVGCGKMGFNLARALLGQGHEVTVIDWDRRRAVVANEQLGGVVVVGDGCESSLLRQAGALRADVFIALTGNDEENLVSCQMAKHRFQVAKTIALVNNPKNEELFRILGVDVQVSGTAIILQHIEEELPAAALVHMQALGSSHRELVSIKIPPDASVIGRLLRDVSMPSGTLPSLVVSLDGQTRFPDEEFFLQAGDQVLVVTSPEGEESVREIFTGVG